MNGGRAVQDRPPQRLRAVLFDMDGTMFNTESLYLEAFRCALRDMGSDIPAERYLGIIGADRMTVERFLIGAYELDTEQKRETFSRLYERYHAHFLSDDRIRPMPGLLELLGYVSDAGLSWGVVSSSPAREIRRLLRCCSIPWEPAVVVDSFSVQRCKPAPDPFLMAAQRLSVDVEACIALEDSPLGIRAAHEAGMHTVMIPYLVQPDQTVLEYADYVVSDLFHVARILNEANKKARA